MGLFESLIDCIETKNSVLEAQDFYHLLNEYAEKIRNLSNPTKLFKICHFLHQEEKFEVLYLICNGQRTSMIEVDVLLIDSLWRLGQIKNFEEVLKETCREVLIEKYLSKASLLIDKFDHLASEKPFWIKFKIMYFTEVSDFNSIRQAIETRKNQSFLYEALALLDTEEPLLSRMILEQKIRESHKYEILPNEMIEYILLSNDDYQRLYIFENNDLKSEIREQLLDIAKTHMNLTPSRIKAENLRLKKALKPSFKIEKRVQKEILPEFPRLYEINSQQVHHNEEARAEYITSQEERKIITRLTFEEYSSAEYGELVKSMIAINFYQAALTIVHKMEFSEEKLYYLGYLNLKVGNYGDCIYFMNEYLNRVNPEDIVPFIKIKLNAHKAQGNINEIKELTSLLHTLGEDV